MVVTHNDAVGIGGIVPSKYFRKSFDRKSKGLKSSLTTLALEHFDVYRVLNTTNLIALIDVQLVASRQLILAGKVKLQFHLKEENAQYFALLNGLFGFGKIKGVTVETKKQVRIFEVEISINHDEEAAAYFSQVFTLLEREINFRKNLRLIRAREERLTAELKQLYSDQFLSV